MEIRDTALTALTEIADARERIADAETAAVLHALRLGIRQGDIAQALRRSREHIRRIETRRRQENGGEL